MKKLITSMFAVAALLAATGAMAEDAKGDAKAGEKKIAMCIGCHGIHGYQASFPEVYRVPKISGQSEKFIVSALNAYKQGERKHPTMRGIAESLSDQDIADVAAYYAGHGVVVGYTAPKAAEPAGKVAELVKKGNCASCHGENFSKPIDPSYPKIAGQHADYLFVALKSYKQEKSTVWGRSNGVMGGIAKQFSNAELKELSKYVAAQEGELKTIPQSKFR
jgi:cytochrome c553